MNRRFFLKISGVAVALASVGGATAKTFEALNLPKAAEWINNKTGMTYIQFGDGFKFLCPRKFDHIQMAIKFYAHSMYDVNEGVWKKHRGDDYVDGFPAPKTAGLPICGYEQLFERGYMTDMGDDPRSMLRYRLNPIAMNRKIVAYRREQGLEIY